MHDPNNDSVDDGLRSKCELAIAAITSQCSNLRQEIESIVEYLPRMYPDKIFPERENMEEVGLYLRRHPSNGSEIWLTVDGKLIEVERPTATIQERVSDGELAVLMRNLGGFMRVIRAIGDAIDELGARNSSA